MVSLYVVFAYFGPETVLPMTSVIATVVGVFMMFGRTTLRVLFRWRRQEKETPRPAGSPPTPHFAAKERERDTASRR